HFLDTQKHFILHSLLYSIFLHLFLNPSAVPETDEEHDLDLSWNELIGGSLHALTSHLNHMTCLSALKLSGCRLNHQDITALGKILFGLCSPFVPSLRLLDLSSNKGVSGHLSLLSSHLSHLSLLETIDLHLSQLTSSDIQALACQRHTLPFKIKFCEYFLNIFPVVAVPYLRCVDVSWCKVVGGRLSLLLDALQPSVLQELRLSSCELTTQDIQHLASACRGGFLSCLRVLDLSYNGSVGSNGWSSLLTSGGLGLLEELDLSLRPFTSAPCSDWLPALLRALPRLAALKRLGLQRWTIDGKEKLQLDHNLKKRILFPWPPPECCRVLL
uniref:Uncharacterized protein n=1 Tax=Periophthalmus magnuspinnatus TaxID=409849 RepID=A0A3B4AAN5_9GOBI